MQPVIGLMSGTSADGVDAALVKLQEDNLSPQVCVLAHATSPYDATLRAQSLAALDNYHCFIWPCWTITEIIIYGRGVYNAELMRLLHGGLAPSAVTTPETYGYPNAALEAILFALLAHATVHGRPGNVPGATGARRAVVLEKIVPA